MGKKQEEVKKTERILSLRKPETVTRVTAAEFDEVLSNTLCEKVEIEMLTIENLYADGIYVGSRVSNETGETGYFVKTD